MHRTNNNDPKIHSKVEDSENLWKSNENNIESKKKNKNKMNSL